MDMNMLLSVIKGQILTQSYLHTLTPPPPPPPPPESQVLQLDDEEEKVRAVPEKRCVLILREIPKDTPKEVWPGPENASYPLVHVLE